MARRRSVLPEIGVEQGRDGTYERPSGLGYGDPAPIPIRKAVFDKFGNAFGRRGLQRTGILGMLAGDRVEVDFEIAHHPLDDVAAQPVVWVQSYASHDRQAVSFDLAGVGGGGR